MAGSTGGLTEVLVTGVTGFVGSHLREALAVRGVHIRALVRSRPSADGLAAEGIEPVMGDLDDESALGRAVAGADVVVHLAAATRARSEAEYQRVNAAGTLRLVEAMLAASPRPRRLVYLSSLAAVGPSVGGRPVERDDPPKPLTAYGRSKLAGEAACARAAGGLEVVVLRAPAVYGPRDRDLLHFFRLAQRGILPLPAGPERRVQLIHGADLADALVKAVMAPTAAGIYHVAEARPYAWAEVARMIARAVGRRARLVYLPGPVVAAAAAVSELAAALAGAATIFNRDKARELLAPGWLCETDAARRDLEFEAMIPLERGLADTATWYRRQGWL